MQILWLIPVILLAACSPIRVYVYDGSTATVTIEHHDAGLLGVTAPNAESVKTGEGDVELPELLPDLTPDLPLPAIPKPITPAPIIPAPVIPAPLPEIPPGSVDPETNANWGEGNLWKPVADSRGGVPVVLTASQYSRGELRLFGPEGEIPTQVEYRGRTNGDRETYYLMNHRATGLPSNLVVEVGPLRFLVPNPTARYD